MNLQGVCNPHAPAERRKRLQAQLGLAQHEEAFDYRHACIET
jgi:hypothetical protein